MKTSSYNFLLLTNLIFIMLVDLTTQSHNYYYVTESDTVQSMFIFF